MRIERQTRDFFLGTHKGAEIYIQRERDPGYESHWYIIVTGKNGGSLYDGWAPKHVVTMAEAKRRAIEGACLDKPKSWWRDLGKPASGGVT
jgi:hypothetical protein